MSVFSMRGVDMKKVILIFMLIASLCLVMGCGKKDTEKITKVPPKNETMKIETNSKLIEKGVSVAKLQEPSALGGEWLLVSAETDGYKFTAEEAGLKSEITIISSEDNMKAEYFSSTEYETKRFEAEVIYVEEPLYYQCENDVWSVKFGIISGDYGEDEEFYATLLNENTLLLRHLFPFDGTQGVSHQTYIRK